MNRFTCSAPGKLFISGEYAVLWGAPSIVTAVDTRATASRGSDARPPSPVLRAVKKHIADYLQLAGNNAEIAELPPVQVDSPGFQHGRDKIGLGSSSATAAAASGYYFEWSGRPVESHRHEILEVAMEAHRSAQGGKGSGADVAAAIRGGTLVFSSGNVLDTISLACVEIVPVWSGRAASTRDLIESTEQLKRGQPRLYNDFFAELTRMAEQIIIAYRQGDAPAVVEATREYGTLMEKLGHHASSPIVTDEHKRIRQIADAVGGGAKPSGAGGGDVALGVFARQSEALDFRREIKKIGFRILDFALEAKGLKREALS